jgi:hypothetical protein
MVGQEVVLPLLDYTFSELYSQNKSMAMAPRCLY